MANGSVINTRSASGLPQGGCTSMCWERKMDAAFNIKVSKWTAKKCCQTPQKSQYCFPPVGEIAFFFLRNLRHKWLNQRKLIFLWVCSDNSLFLSKTSKQSKKSKPQNAKLFRNGPFHTQIKYTSIQIPFLEPKMVPTLPQTKCKTNNLRPQQPENSCWSRYHIFWVGNRLFLPKYHSDVGSSAQNQIAWKMNTAKWRLNQNDTHHLPHTIMHSSLLSGKTCGELWHKPK